MFCRYCGSHIADDSLFCAKCGKRLGRKEHPRVDNAVRVLGLKTPYPYFGLLFLLFAFWAFRAMNPFREPVDYSHLKWTLTEDRQLDVVEDNLFQQGFSLVLENTGTSAVREVPVQLLARVEPAKPVEVVATFAGRQLIIAQQGRPLPLVVVLGDQVEPGAKRNFVLEGSIRAEKPFKVTYEVREENSSVILASYVVER